MATLSAKKIVEALSRARNVGQVEEAACIDGCEIVLRSLRPDEHLTIQTDCSEHDDAAFLDAWRKEHICRSLVEFNGTDLREIDSIEIEVEELNGKGLPEIKPIQVETHAFVRDYILNTWSREAIDVAYRKYNDVVEKAERQANAGVTFVVAEETAEEKFRRLLGEMKEIDGHLPAELRNKILEEAGYLQKVTTEEAEAAHTRLANLAAEQEAADATIATPPPEPEAAPAPVIRPGPQARPAAQQVAPQVRPQARPAPTPPPAQEASPQPRRPQQAVAGMSPAQMMSQRHPLNRVAADRPLPIPTYSAPLPPTLPVPEEDDGGPPAHLRTSRIQALEEAAGLPVDPRRVGLPQNATALTDSSEIIELKKNVGVDPKSVEPIFEQPPAAGINPRFRRPPTL